MKHLGTALTGTALTGTALIGTALVLGGCRDRDDRAPQKAAAIPTVVQSVSTIGVARQARDGGAGPKAAQPTGLERPVQLIYELDVTRLPREWQPHGVNEASARLASLLRKLLAKQGLVGRVDLQLEPAPTIRLSFRDLLPAEQARLVAEIRSQGAASAAVMGGVKLFREHLGQDPVRLREACKRRSAELSLEAEQADTLCDAWGSLPDRVRECVGRRDLWATLSRCGSGQEKQSGALVASLLPCFATHAAAAQLALRGGLVAIIDLSQPKPPDSVELTALVRKGLGEAGPPCQVLVTGRDEAYRLRVMVAYEADTKRDLKAFGRSLGDWLQPGLDAQLQLGEVEWVGPSVSTDSLKRYCGLPKLLPEGLQSCLSHPAVQAPCTAR